MENVKKCKNFLSTLIKLASSGKQSTETAANVKELVQSLLVRARPGRSARQCLWDTGRAGGRGSRASPATGARGPGWPPGGFTERPLWGPAPRSFAASPFSSLACFPGHPREERGSR